MEKYEVLKFQQSFVERLSDLVAVVKPVELADTITGLEAKMAESTFWDDSNEASAHVMRVNYLKSKVQDCEKISEMLEELGVLIDFEDYGSDTECLIEDIIKTLDEVETKQLLDGEYDSLNAIVELHPGAGGTESQDWALMLFRMFKRYCEKSKYKLEIVDYQEANEAGIKSVTFIVKGDFAYGHLKSERGVHRLVRISPFDSNARRHTSFAACNVTPEISLSQQSEIEIKPDEVKIDTYRSSGAGGQSVNTTDSAIRITHLPSGIVVTCQNERSQNQNKEQAFSILKAKLYRLAHQERESKIKSISGDLDENAFGSQIRSYVLQPYTLVKDHRTDFESSNTSEVLDGDLNGFIKSYLKYIKTEVN